MEKFKRSNSRGYWIPASAGMTMINGLQDLLGLPTQQLTLEHISKIVDQVSGQGAGRRKSGAYTVVCEHFEPIRNAVMDPNMHF